MDYASGQIEQYFTVQDAGEEEVKRVSFKKRKKQRKGERKKCLKAPETIIL